VAAAQAFARRFAGSIDITVLVDFDNDSVRTAIDVDMLTSRRAEPVSFVVDASGDKIGDESGNHMENLEVVFRVTFPDGKDGDRAREVLPQAIARSHDRLCTVSRTVEIGTPVKTYAE
jgi:uncharacterized OsmC-like protein